MKALVLAYTAFFLFIGVGALILCKADTASLVMYLGSSAFISSLPCLAACIPLHMSRARYPHLFLIFCGMLTMFSILLSYGAAFSRSGLVDGDKNISHSFADGLYFSVTTFTTLGYGDLAPNKPSLRLLTSMEAITGTLFMPVTTAYFWLLISMKLPTKRDADEPSSNHA